MRDCEDGEIRDLLPDHARGALVGAERARVEAHLAACPDCRAELALLHAVRAARPTPMLAPAEVARIVAAMPRAGTRTAETPGVVSLDAHRARAAVPWYRVAAVAAVLVGVAGVGVFGHREGAGGSRVGPTGLAVDSPLAMQGVGSVRPTASVDTLVRGAVGTPRAARPTASVTTDALGALGGVTSGATDDELEALIGGLDSLSGIPEVEAVEGEESVRTGGEP